ncbi:hypothetical protein MBLNU459_g4620t1 [Dothideomycetes sp. NU459]
MTAEEGEDDYMSMTFAEAAPTAPATSLQRQHLKRKRGELKARVKSNAEREAEAEAAREAALATALDSSNRGAKLMAKLGYKGGALGKGGDARTAPIELSMKDDRGGIGMDSEKKRKIREAMEAAQGKEKRQKADEDEFVERTRREREQKRNEGQFIGAMKVAEKLDTEAEEDRQQQEARERGREDTESGTRTADSSSQKVNILWRNLVRHREERDRERKLRHGMLLSLSRRPRDEDPEEDSDDRIALGTEVEELEEQEDQELNHFNALEPAERLQKVVEYLRDTYHYCFWCKYRYPDAKMEGCPGRTEEDHD